jgi:hypothetical protein
MTCSNVPPCFPSPAAAAARTARPPSARRGGGGSPAGRLPAPALTTSTTARRQRRWEGWGGTAKEGLRTPSVLPRGTTTARSSIWALGTARPPRCLAISRRVRRPPVPCDPSLPPSLPPAPVSLQIATPTHPHLAIGYRRCSRACDIQHADADLEAGLRLHQGHQPCDVARHAHIAGPQVLDRGRALWRRARRPRVQERAT